MEQKQDTRSLITRYSEITTKYGSRSPQRQEWLLGLARVSKRSVFTALRWVLGYNEPDALAKDAIAKHLGSTPEILFPPKAAK